MEKVLKDKSVILLVGILLVFTIIYFIAVNKASYAFSSDYDANNSYKNTIDIIKKCAIAYGEQNSDLFKKDSIIYVKVQDLIDDNLLATNEDGKIINPLNTNENLNSNIVKIKKEKDSIEAEVDS